MGRVSLHGTSWAVLLQNTTAVLSTSAEFRCGPHSIPLSLFLGALMDQPFSKALRRNLRRCADVDPQRLCPAGGRRFAPNACVINRGGMAPPLRRSGEPPQVATMARDGFREMMSRSETGQTSPTDPPPPFWSLQRPWPHAPGPGLPPAGPLQGHPGHPNTRGLGQRRWIF